MSSSARKPLLDDAYRGGSPTSWPEGRPIPTYGKGVRDWDTQDFAEAAAGGSSSLWVKVRLLVYAIGSVAGSVTMTVAMKLAGDHLPNFPFFIFAISACAIGVFFGSVALVVRYTTSLITAEQRAVPVWFFAVIGLLSSLNGLLLLFSNPHVSGITESLFGPTVVTIPLSLLASWALLRRRYSLLQIGCVLIILGGLVVAFWPTIQGSSSSSSSGSDSSVWWTVCWISGSLPLVGATIFQEKVLSDVELDLSYMLGFVGVFQFLSVIVIAGPAAIIPGFGTASSLGVLWEHQKTAFACVLEQDVSAADCPGCECDGTALVIALLVVGYIATNSFQVGLIKEGSATLSFLVNGITTPLTTLAFSLHAIMGDQAEKMDIYNYIALGVIVLGSILYRVVGTEPSSRDIARVRSTSRANSDLGLPSDYAAPRRRVN